MTMRNPPDPPRFGRYVLKLIYGQQYFDEIAGDMLEMHTDRLQHMSKNRANLLFIRDCLLSFRNYDLKTSSRNTQSNTIAMLKNYLIITLRTLSKNKVYSSLNILGLALGIAACLFIVQYVSYERSFDKFHANHKDLYRVRYKVWQSEELRIDCAAAVPRVGPFMKEKMPEVREFARAFPISAVMTYEDIRFREDRLHIADPAFLKMFTFPMIKGDAETALQEPNKVVITEEMARKYFGEEDPIGKVLRYDGWGTHNLEVTGVTKNVPDNSHFKYDFLISYETLNNQTRNDDGTASSETAWGWYDFNTYVLLEPGTDPEVFDTRFAEYIQDELSESYEKYNYKQEFPLQAITDIHLYSNLLQESEPEEQGDGQAVFFLTIVAFFIMLIAWINYINLATARSIERAKEVGVRKTMGAYRRQLVYQFLSESVILNLIALILGILIVVLGINTFNNLTDSRLSLLFLSDPTFWLVLTGIFLGGSLLSGLYPAFVLSSFRPATVLKGRLIASRSGNLLRKLLVVFQFAASITLISGTLVVYEQLAHMRNVDLGFTMTETLVVKGPAVFGVDSLFGEANEAFKNELLSLTGIAHVTSSSNVPGDEIFWTNGIRRSDQNDDENKTTYIVGVDHGYFPAYGIQFLAGRNYGRSFTTDTGSIILNKAGIEMLGFTSPEEALNKKVRFWGRNKTIVGVVDDYNQMSAKSAVSPIVFPLVENDVSYYTIKLSNLDYQQAFDQVQAKYDMFFPGNPFDYFFLDDFFNRQYRNDYTFSRVFTLFAGFAILVACLGLFGLSSYSATQKTKEIGIRKAIGADVANIVYLLSREFLVLVVVANVIAWPIAYFIMDAWLRNFATRIDIGVLVFITAAFLVICIAIIAVGYKTIRTARSNPVNALRYE